MKKQNFIKVAGVVCTVIGACVTVAQNYISDKQLETLVDEKVTEKIMKSNKQ